MFFEGVEVMLAVIRGAPFPTGVIDTDQFVAQGSDRLVVFALWLAFLILIIAFGPRFCFEGAAGIFVKGLPAELWGVWNARACVPLWRRTAEKRR